MIRLLRLLIPILVLLSFATANFAAQTLVIDEKHSYVMWRIKHLGFSTQTGKWYVTGTLTMDREHPENSKVEASIDLAKIVTGIPELDKHLKDKLFFDVTSFPTATFVSDKVEVTGDTTAKVFGTLKLHGISKPVTLDVTLNKVGTNPITDKPTAGFTATTQLKRSDFDMKAFLPDLGDEVSIEIGVEASPAN